MVTGQGQGGGESSSLALCMFAAVSVVVVGTQHKPVSSAASACNRVLCTNATNASGNGSTGLSADEGGDSIATIPPSSSSSSVSLSSTSPSQYGNKPITALGLSNLGNTCFVNSTLQALASHPVFLEYLEKRLRSWEEPKEDLPFTWELWACLASLRPSVSSSSSHSSSGEDDEDQEEEGSRSRSIGDGDGDGDNAAAAAAASSACAVAQQRPVEGVTGTDLASASSGGQRSAHTAPTTGGGGGGGGGGGEEEAESADVTAVSAPSAWADSLSPAFLARNASVQLSLQLHLPLPLPLPLPLSVQSRSPSRLFRLWRTVIDYASCVSQSSLLAVAGIARAAYASLFGGAAYTPRRIVDMLVRRNAVFAMNSGMLQQDALECLQTIQLILEEEEEEGAEEEEEEEEKQIGEKGRGGSGGGGAEVPPPTLGTLSSQITCMQCQASKPSRLETFHALSLPIPSAFQALASQTNAKYSGSSSGSSGSSGSAHSPSEDGKSASELDLATPVPPPVFQAAAAAAAPVASYAKIRGDSYKNVDLADCLRLFTAGEAIEGVRCESKACPGHRSGGATAVKALSILEPGPRMLIFHLVRRVYSEAGVGRGGGGAYRKIQCHVRFPETLDMQPYLRRPDYGTTAATSKGNGKGEGRGSRSVYSLRAVVVHVGSAEMGHYVTYARCSASAWYYFSDTVVQRVSLEQVLAAQAYLLFYD